MKSFSAPSLKYTYLSRRPQSGSIQIALISIGILYLASRFYWENGLGLASSLPATPNAVFKNQEYWRLFTALFIHADISHFLGNAFSLGALSLLLYGYYGKIAYPILTLIMGAAVNALSLLTYPPTTHLLGASGAIYYMAGFWLMLYVLIDRRFSIIMRIFRVTGFCLVLLVPTTYDPDVSYRAHGIGFAMGMFCAPFYFWVKKHYLRTFEVVREDFD